ncbi:hypothetical protein BDZ85DRAFT_257494 [Elsinoe ampelina]|uniref:Peroxisomal trans-2-enoyl-CoA reductase n=1 Tax=Elsinoe ampelina TaxID=302913 RepID=A0A6A6GIA4_9PEZI|nr:hypothetical protein BDZ85DRAFT_257494 [Elsinoe ampelina]
MAGPSTNGTGTNLAPGETESQHFSPYRSDGKLYGFVCIVTNATSPIGQSIITELSTHGAASIYACTLPSSPSFPSPSSTPSHPTGQTKIIPYPYLPTEEGTLQLIDDVLNAHGRLDIWTTIATSPASGPKSLSSTTPSHLSSLFEANALVPFYALKYAPPAMAKLCIKGSYPNAAPKEQRYGSVIVVAGMGPGPTGWGMSFQAGMGVVKGGVRELMGTGVRVNGIRYAGVEGEEGVDARGEGRKGRTEEVARVAGFLASGFSVHVTGSEIVVDGGASAIGGF